MSNTEELCDTCGKNNGWYNQTCCKECVEKCCDGSGCEKCCDGSECELCCDGSGCEGCSKNVEEIDEWVIERFGEGHTWTLLSGGLTPDEEDKVYCRMPNFHVLEDDGTSSKGIAILWEDDEDITCDQCEKKFPEKDTTIVRGWDWCPDCVKGGKSEPLAMD